MDIGSAGAIASFAYTSALRSGSDQAQALQQAYQTASSLGVDQSALFGAASADASLLGASSQGSLNTGAFALAQQTGEASSFLQGFLAATGGTSAISALGTGSGSGLEGLSVPVSSALAAYQYQTAVYNNTQQVYLQQLMGMNGLNLLS